VRGAVRLLEPWRSASGHVRARLCTSPGSAAAGSTMTDRADALLDELAAITGRRRPDMVDVVTPMTLSDVRELLEGAGRAEEWSIRVLADTLEEIHELARRQAYRDWSIGGRRHRIVGL